MRSAPLKPPLLMPPPLTPSPLTPPLLTQRPLTPRPLTPRVRLQTWKNKLQEICEAKFLSVTRLQDDCPVLASLQSTDLELPGQHQNLVEFSPEHVVHLEMVSSNAVVLRRHCVTLRRIELICSDGRSRFFTVHCGQPHGLHGTDERIVSVHRCAFCAICCARSAVPRSQSFSRLSQYESSTRHRVL